MTYVFDFLLIQYRRNLGDSITCNHVLQVLCVCRKGALVVSGSLVVRRWWRSKQLRLVVIARGILLYVYIFVVFSQSYSNDGVQQLNERDKCNQISDSLKNKTL